jgi:hypothetical protein
MGGSVQKVSNKMENMKQSDDDTDNSTAPKTLLEETSETGVITTATTNNLTATTIPETNNDNTTETNLAQGTDHRRTWPGSFVPNEMEYFTTKKSRQLQPLRQQQQTKVKSDMNATQGGKPPGERRQGGGWAAFRSTVEEAARAASPI